jgi:hypothetical protein
MNDKKQTVVLSQEDAATLEKMKARSTKKPALPMLMAFL